MIEVCATRDFEWLKERTGCALTAEARAIQAVDMQGQIIAMVAFDLWTPNAAWMHVALEYRSALRHILRPAFEYLFGQQRKNIALAGVLSSNTKSCRLVEKLGFCELYRILDGWSYGDDMIIYGMRAAECRWI